MTEHMRKLAAVLIAFAMSVSATIQGDLSRSSGKVEQSATEAQNEAENGTEEVCGYVLEYSAPYNVTENHLTRSNGSIRYNGHRETWYSTNEGCGKNTTWTIPGKHVADDGTIRDADGFICVASSDHKKHAIIMTSVGPGKVYDTGCSHGTIDVYTNW